MATNANTRPSGEIALPPPPRPLGKLHSRRRADLKIDRACFSGRLPPPHHERRHCGQRTYRGSHDPRCWSNAAWSREGSGYLQHMPDIPRRLPAFIRLPPETCFDYALDGRRFYRLRPCCGTRLPVSISYSTQPSE
jgi:hypothetical protein